MRTLSATLTAAQKSASGAPHVRAFLDDVWGSIQRLRFTRYYTGSEGANYAAAFLAADGSLLRARIDPSTSKLMVSRVTSPGAGSTYSSWTDTGVTAWSTVPVSFFEHGGEIDLLHVSSTGLVIQYLYSTDNGATWNGPFAAVTALAVPGFVCASGGPANGDAVIFWNEGATVYRSRLSAGAWGARTAWTNTVNNVTGLAVRYRGDWDLVVCGTEATTLDAKLWTCVYGNGLLEAANVWSVLREQLSAESDSNVSFKAPAVGHLNHWRMWFVEKYAGTVAYDRVYWTTMETLFDFAQSNWREPVPFPHNSTYGLAGADAGALWLVSSSGVWYSPASGATLDVSADVVEASLELEEGGGRAALSLRNDPATASGTAGRYTGSAVVRRGYRLQLGAGYKTTAGNEYSANPYFWVESLEYIAPSTGSGQAVVRVVARDIWWILERWRARRQFTWAAGTRTVSQLLQFVCTRAGVITVLGSTSSAYTTLQPAFTIHVGESGKTAAQRLLAMVPDVARGEGADLKVMLPGASDAQVYDYVAPVTGQSVASGVHAVKGAAYRDQAPPVNRARVSGAAVFDERFDFPEIEAVGEAIAQVSDLNLTTSGQAGDRGDSVLRDAALAARSDELTVFGVNTGQELYDVVGVTDALMGLSDVSRRVRGLSWSYSGPRGRYEMQLELGGV